MDIYLDCLPCILRQALEASRMSTNDTALHGKIMEEAIGVLERYKSYRNSPEVARDIHRIVKAQTGAADPYYAIKQRDIQTALQLYPKLKQYIGGKQDQLYWALKAAATGNVFDVAISCSSHMEESMMAELNKPFTVCDIDSFKEQLKTAKSLLVIGDNAGETVFDCMLLEQFSGLDLSYAVRSKAILNDATMEDANASGVSRYARIIATGCDVPGIILEECSKPFLDTFYSADIVISKGQGNYETLSDCDRDVYFLLKAKCPVLSKLLGVGVNEYVFKHIDGIPAKH